MAPRMRTFFIKFVSVTGFFYFLYIIYISNFYGPLYKPISRNRDLGKILYSSSSVRPKKKGGILVHFYTVLGNSRKKNNNNNNRSYRLSDNFRSKREGKNVALAGNYTKDNLYTPPLADSKSSNIQRIPPKEEKITLDIITQGIQTRKLYDSGFIVTNAELCPDLGNNLEIVILIMSAPGNVEAREAIRLTWGHFGLRNDVAIAFILGRSSASRETLIKDEYILYGDVILANFYDSYTNLTLKSTSILEWVDNYCNRAKFILKTDDDMFINIPKLLVFMSKHRKDKRKIFGRLAQKWKPIRKKSSKYYVSKRQYRPPLFPDFTTGPAYLMTSDVIHDLYTTALDTVYLTLEDVFTTGIVAQEKNVERVNVDGFLNYYLNVLAFNVTKTITIHSVRPFEQFVLWSVLDKRTQD